MPVRNIRIHCCENDISSVLRCYTYSYISVPPVTEYSDTSANEDNSFRNHIR